LRETHFECLDRCSIRLKELVWFHSFGLRLRSGPNQDGSYLPAALCPTPSAHANNLSKTAVDDIIIHNYSPLRARYQGRHIFGGDRTLTGDCVKAGDDLLSPWTDYHRPRVLNGRVRDGNGCGHSGLVTGSTGGRIGRRIRVRRVLWSIWWARVASCSV
jgi:hypothetical protein